MGWDFRHMVPVDRRAGCREEISDRYEILKDRLVGSVWYAAIRNKTTGEVKAVVTRTSVRSDEYCNFGTKSITEDMGPFHYDCPESILRLLTPTTDRYANEWRRRCREISASKETLRNAPFGARLKVVLDDDTMLTVVKEKPGYRFKSWWLLVENEHKYVPKTRVKTAEII